MQDLGCELCGAADVVLINSVDEHKSYQLETICEQCYWLLCDFCTLSGIAGLTAADLLNLCALVDNGSAYGISKEVLDNALAALDLHPDHSDIGTLTAILAVLVKLRQGARSSEQTTTRGGV